MAFRSWISGSCALLAVVAGCDGDEESAGPADAGTDAALVADAGTLPPTPDGGSAAKLSAQAVLAGACEMMRLATDATQCAGLEQLVMCSEAQCGLAACMATCQDYLQCVTSADQSCAAARSCKRSNECSVCFSSLQVCSLGVKCAGLYSCATTLPGGACSKLEACCATQRMPLACHMFALGNGMLGGDPACEKLVQNPAFVKVYASDPPCSMQ
jgi:hypothetical protein